ncbi:DUF2752 domain-containing protein [Trichothermofontia sp.]
MYPIWRLSTQRLSVSDRQQRWGALVLVAAPLIGAPLYNLGFRIPGLVCPLRHWTGIPCPTCGMTRSLMAVVRGEWDQAFIHHLFGPFLFIGLILCVMHWVIELLSDHQVQAFYSPWVRACGRDRRYPLTALGLLLGYHALRLSYLTTTGELQQAFWQSPLGQWLGMVT